MSFLQHSKEIVYYKVCDELCDHLVYGFNYLRSFLNNLNYGRGFLADQRDCVNCGVCKTPMTWFNCYAVVQYLVCLFNGKKYTLFPQSVS